MQTTETTNAAREAGRIISGQTRDGFPIYAIIAKAESADDGFEIHHAPAVGSRYNRPKGQSYGWFRTMRAAEMALIERVKAGTYCRE